MQTALGELAASQAAMTKLSAEENDAFAKNKQDLQDCIDGVRTALGVLRDHYGGRDKAHEAAGEEAQESLDCSRWSSLIHPQILRKTPRVTFSGERK